MEVPCTSALLLLFTVVILTVTIVPCSPFLFDNLGEGGTVTGNTSPIRVGAFVARSFGPNLMDEDELVSNLVKIFKRYDIVLVQEIRDSSLTAVRDFLTSLKLGGEDWAFAASQPLGRSGGHREQYVYFYKTARVKVISSYQVADDVRDVYERPPFGVEIEYPSVANYNTNKRVTLLGLRTRTDDVEEELREFSKTITATASKFNQSLGVIAMGDLHADCNLLDDYDREQLDLFSSSSFESLIDDDADTYVSRDYDCAYDRVLVYKNCLDEVVGTDTGTGSSSSSTISCLDVRKAGVYNFESLLRIDDDEEDAALEISHHYPVEFSLY